MSNNFIDICKNDMDMIYKSTYRLIGQRAG